MTHETCRLIAKNRDQLRNPALGNRVWVTFLTQQPYKGATVDVFRGQAVSPKKLFATLNYLSRHPRLVGETSFGETSCRGKGDARLPYKANGQCERAG